MPPVQGFWSLTLYNEYTFFYPDELNRYPFGPENKNLHRAGDGSLTPGLLGHLAADQELRAYWPGQPILRRRQEGRRR